MNEKKKKKVAHLTSVHQRYDTRIFYKMCCSLSKNHYEVYLIVADGKKSEKNNQVNIINASNKAKKRIFRMVLSVNDIFKKAVKINADIYHFHDPELLPISLKLKKLGKKVIFDSHEDYPKQFLDKPYLNKLTRLFLSKLFEKYEKIICNRLDAVVAATPFIAKKFVKINKNTLNINNYPIITKPKNIGLWKNKKNEVCLIGGISKIRGIEQILEAISYFDDLKINWAGRADDKIYLDEIKKHKNWKKINELGFLNRKELTKVLARSKIGLATLLPADNHINALPTKMFEYMLAGIPVIASDFPLWKKIIEGENCGICVNPCKPKQIAKAINFLFSNPLLAKKMGENGIKAVLSKYNWVIEEKKLLKLYREL